MRSLMIAALFAIGFALTGSSPSQSAPATSGITGQQAGSESLITDVRWRCHYRCWHRWQSRRHCARRCWRW
jgi:uncharacterized membrane protein